MHKERKLRMIDGKTGWVGKTAIMGVLERKGKVRKPVTICTVRRNPGHNIAIANTQ